MIGLIGRKCGMTRRFTEDGESIPVTVVEVLPNRVTQIKTNDKDGYQAVQITMGEKRTSLLNKPAKGHFAKASVGGGDGLWEFRVESDESLGSDKKLESLSLGDEISLDVFSVGQTVDVSGVSKGKGFSGVIKRHNFRSQDATHGNSLAHRAPGSIGQNQTPGRVFKGKKMAGQYGNANCTLQNLKVIEIDQERKLILIKGAIPGATKSVVVIKKAVKTKEKA